MCTIPEVVRQYIPKELDEQIFEPNVKLSDFLFRNDVAEVYILFILDFIFIFLSAKNDISFLF